MVQVAAMPTFVFNLDSPIHINGVNPVSVGDTFVAKGIENPTTGYVWNVANDVAHACGPEGSITYTEKYVQDVNPNGFVGVGGRKTITFQVTEKAVKGSSCKIGLTYMQPWELKTGWQTQTDQSFIIQIQ